MRFNKNQVQYSLMIGVFLSGIITGIVGFVAYASFTSTPTLSILRESDLSTAHAEYHFIDPLIATRGIVNSARYNDMKQEVNSFISQEENNGLMTATVYFRDINALDGFTLNPTERYTPASLNKVPVMMAYYKIAETDPSILTDGIRYVGTLDTNQVQEIRSEKKLILGNVYTVEELIEYMIRYSDNNAVGLLIAYLQTTDRMKEYTAVFSELGIDPSILDRYADALTAQQYAIFLRTLYNATYLNRSYSEKALKLLSETEFKEGIQAGVPTDVVVAEKFGEVRMTDTKGAFIGKQINNCGIVYYPKHPYLLCVMTKGRANDISLLEHDIATISHIVYTHLKKLYP